VSGSISARTRARRGSRTSRSTPRPPETGTCRTKLDLPDPPATSDRLAWPLRATDIDLHDHVNNALHWQAVEQRLFKRGIDTRRPLTARLDYGDPLEFGDLVELAEWSEDGRYALAFVVGG
jgi:Acyl-ACP thioesterase